MLDQTGRLSPTGAAQAGGENPRKKNFRLHQSKIDQAMKVLGTRTETETIEQALDLIVFQRQLLDGIDALYGGGIVNVFEDTGD